MTKEEITQKIDECIANGLSNIGQIMKEFSTLPVDKKLVSEILKTKI